MSADVLSPAADAGAVDFPYKAISRGAIASLIFFVVALFGLIPTFYLLLVMTVPGLIAGIVALRTIKRYPREYGGKNLALVGLTACLALLVGGVALHTYIYLTEVPEGYTRVPFYKLQSDKSGPDVPTEIATAIDGKAIFLKGYMHPSSGSGMLRHFVLVPDLGTCCFGGQPRSSDMIEVTLSGGQTVAGGQKTKMKLAGTFQLNRVPRSKSDFDNALYYKMRVDQLQ